MNLTLPGHIALAALLLSTTALAEPASPKLLLSEDFEATAVGAIPKGFTKTGAVGVVDDVAHEWKKVAAHRAGSEWVDARSRSGAGDHRLGWAALGPALLQGEAAIPSSRSCRKGKRPASSIRPSSVARRPVRSRMIRSRCGCSAPSSTRTGRSNTSTTCSRGSGPSSRSARKRPCTPTEDWTLVEWSVDHATQSFRFFINGEEIKEMGFSKGEGHFEGAEIPAVFESLSFGWTNYQPAAGEGFPRGSTTSPSAKSGSAQPSRPLR